MQVWAIQGKPDVGARIRTGVRVRAHIAKGAGLRDGKGPSLSGYLPPGHSRNDMVLSQTPECRRASPSSMPRQGGKPRTDRDLWIISSGFEEMHPGKQKMMRKTMEEQRRKIRIQSFS